MILRNLRLDKGQFDPMIATGTSVRFRYVDGKKTDVQDGFAISVILPNMGYERLTLKVSTVPDELTPAAFTASNPVTIIPVGDFSATLYQGSNGAVGVSLKADTVDVVKK